MEIITDEDKKYARTILEAAYGRRFAQQVNIDDSTFVALSEILLESGNCSDGIDLVPRPHSSLARPAISYALKLIKQVGKELLINPAKKNYYICNLFAFRSRQAMFF